MIFELDFLSIIQNIQRFIQEFGTAETYAEIYDCSVTNKVTQILRRHLIFPSKLITCRNPSKSILQPFFLYITSNPFLNF